MGRLAQGAVYMVAVLGGCSMALVSADCDFYLLFSTSWCRNHFFPPVGALFLALYMVFSQEKHLLVGEP